MYFLIFLQMTIHFYTKSETSQRRKENPQTSQSARIVDYSQFSSCVLQDEGSIEAGYGPKPKNIMNEVFSEWMEGRGRSPVSWRTLISCLEKTDFRELAGELNYKKEIDGGLSVEDGDGGGDSGTFKEEETTDTESDML